MACEYAFLTKDQRPQIYRTFQEAFADYYLDMSYLTEKILFNRAAKNGVEFEYSVGVFDKSRMVGVTLIGIDIWKNTLAAFDAGTGIIPAFRGQGIAKKMFDYAVPKLKKRGVKKFILEVLQINEPAVKAYRTAGFEAARELDCFELILKNAALSTTCKIPIEIHSIGTDTLASFEQHLDWQPSWENSFASIRRIKHEISMYGAFHKNECVGFLAYYPLLNWIMSIVVSGEFRRQGIATCLLAHLVNNLDAKQTTVRLNNVDHSDGAMLKLLEKNGFELFANQFEMELNM